jgi:hypothetical protein
MHLLQKKKIISCEKVQCSHTQLIREFEKQDRSLQNLRLKSDRETHHGLHVSDSKGMKEMRKPQKLFCPAFQLYWRLFSVDHFDPMENPARTSPLKQQHRFDAEVRSTETINCNI